MVSEQYGVVFCRYLKSAALSGALMQRSTPVVVDLDDIDEGVIWSRINARTTSLAKRVLLRYQLIQATSIAARLRHQCRHLFIASESDRRYVGSSPATVLRNIPFEEPAPLEPAPVRGGVAETVVLFVGTYIHGPNRDGVLHFVSACWPAIRIRYPQAVFRIVGSGGWDALRESLEATPGVRVVGAVDDLSFEYDASSICVVPVFEGAGTKIKLLEALRRGRPVVSSAHSVKGHAELEGHGVVVAHDDRTMIGACIDLLADPAGARDLSALGQAIVKRDYSLDAFCRSVSDGLELAGVVGPMSSRT